MFSFRLATVEKHERVLCVLLKEKHETFREIFPRRETVLRAHRIKSDEKPFLCDIFFFFFLRGGAMVHIVTDRYFLYF